MQIGLGTGIRSAFAVGAVAAGMMFAGSARADVVSFDTTLASPNTNAASTDPVNSSTNNSSWYDGTGNPQGGWTVSNSGAIANAPDGIEIGLRAKYRQVNGVIDTPNNVYVVSPGLQSGTSDAAWNYEFSIDLRPDGIGSLTLASISKSTLTVTDLTTGATNTILLSSLAGDDSGFGGGPNGANGNTGPDRVSEASDPTDFAAGWGAQNSENATFGNWPLAGLQGFNPNAADTYEFVLDVRNNDNAILASDAIEVQVTPEPSAVILLATMVLGAFVLARRRRATQL
jgi:hypothetical protein